MDLKQQSLFPPILLATELFYNNPAFLSSFSLSIPLMFLSQNGYFALKIGKISLEFLHFPAIIGKGFIPTLYFYEGLLVTMERKFSQFHNGLRDGVPIGLGYLAVSFTFGIAAQLKGLTVFQSVLMSFTNLTSAGQFAALGVIQTGAPYIELALIQIIINLRYCLMSFSLSQKLSRDSRFSTAFSWLSEWQTRYSAFLHAGPAC